MSGKGQKRGLYWTEKRLDELEEVLPPIYRHLDWPTCRAGHPLIELTGWVDGYPFVMPGGRCRRCKLDWDRRRKRAAKEAAS